MGKAAGLLGFLAGLLVVEEGPEVPDTCGDDGADHRADPVDPVVDREGTGGDGGTQASCRVQASAGVVDADQVADEEGDTDTDGSKVVQGGLFDNGHQDGDAQDTGAEGLNHQASTLGAAAAQGVGKQDRARGHGAGGTAGSHAGHELGDHHAETLDRVHGSGEDEREGDGWVQVTAGHSGGQEDTHHDAEAEAEGNHDDFGRVGGVCVVERVVVGGAGNHVCAPEEHKRADELTGDNHQQVFERALERKAELLVSLRSSVWGCCGVAEALFWVHCDLLSVCRGRRCTRVSSRRTTTATGDSTSGRRSAGEEKNSNRQRNKNLAPGPRGSRGSTANQGSKSKKKRVLLLQQGRNPNPATPDLPKLPNVPDCCKTQSMPDICKHNNTTHPDSSTETVN